MDIITCPSTDDFKVFPGGAVAIRAAAYPGAARGTLAEIVSSEAMSGSYLEDTQEVPWGGVDHLEALDPLDADDTVTIDPSTVDLRSSLYYWPFVTVRLQGVADDGTPGDADSGRAVESFWNYDPFVFAVYCSDSDFASVLGETSLPRNQTQFSLIRMIGAANVLDPNASNWRFRLFKREVQGGTVALQIEQIVVLPVAVPFMATRFAFGSTANGDEVVETAPETSLENGIYTIDQGQPRGNVFDDVPDLQDNDGSDPEVTVENLAPVIPKSFFYIGGGIVHVPKGNIEDDTFDRSVTIEPPFGGTGGVVNAAWGNSPYGFRWRVGDDTLGIGKGVTETDIGVNGSEGVISRVQDLDVDPDPADSSHCFWLIMSGRVENVGEFGGPSVGDSRDFMVEAEVEWDSLPASFFELDVGQFVFSGGVEAGVSSSLTARLLCEPDGDLTLFFNRWYYSQAGSPPLPGPPNTGGAWANADVDQDWPTPFSIGTYTPGDIVHLKFARRGYDVYGRAWLDGDTEPSTWQIQERIQVPYLVLSVVNWDDYDYPQGDTLRFAWLPNGDPGLRVAVDPENQDPGIEVLCHRFKVDFWQDEDADFDPTDVFLRVNEVGSATVLGAELNMEWKSQNWVFVGKRQWPNIDIYQWNDVDSIPIQWMSTGLTYSRRVAFVPQIYRRVFG